MNHQGQSSFTPTPVRRSGLSSRRHGAVLVETALVLTLLLALCFGVMEYGHFVYTRHTLEAAAHHGTRTAILPDATDAEITAAVDRIMASSGYDTDDYTVTTQTVGSEISVTVQCSWGTVGVRPMGLISADRAVEATVVMRKEGP